MTADVARLEQAAVQRDGLASALDQATRLGQRAGRSSMRFMWPSPVR